MKGREFRREVERRVGRSLADTEWEKAENAGAVDPYSPAYGKGDVADAVAFFGADHKEPVPSDWLERSRRLFARYEPQRQSSMALFELGGPLTFEELDGFLRGIAAGEPQDADTADLFYATPERQRRLTVRHGGRLWQLKQTAESMADATGCDPAEAVAFLLCGRELLMPWVSVQTRMIGTGAGMSVRFTIEVGTPEVPLNEVRAAYSRARDHAASGAARNVVDLIMGLPPRRPRGRKERTIRTYELVSFCEQVGAGSGMPWAQAYAEWEALHPDWHYTGARNFERAYRFAKGREVRHG